MFVWDLLHSGWLNTVNFGDLGEMSQKCPIRLANMTSWPSPVIVLEQLSVIVTPVWPPSPAANEDLLQSRNPLLNHVIMLVIAATERGPHPNCNYLRMAFESSWLTGAFSEAFKNPFTVSWDPCSILNLPVDWQFEYYCLETSRHSTNDVSMIWMPIWWENKQNFNYTTRWWFQILFIFTPTWGNDPIWLIYFRWVETTN